MEVKIKFDTSEGLETLDISKKPNGFHVDYIGGGWHGVDADRAAKALVQMMERNEDLKKIVVLAANKCFLNHFFNK